MICPLRHAAAGLGFDKIHEFCPLRHAAAGLAPETEKQAVY